MVKDKKTFDNITKMCGDLDMPFYQRVLLISMVYRKVKHPKEKIKDILEKVTSDTVPELYKKYKGKNVLKISVQKELEKLEQELHNCRNLPEELFVGDIVKNTIKYYALLTQEKTIDD